MTKATKAAPADLELPPEPATEPQAAEQPEQLIPLADLNDEIVRVANQLSQERGRVMALQAKQRQTRTALGAAVSSFTAGLVVKTREALQREHIASEQARKAAIAAGTVPAQRGSMHKPGPSAIDRTAFYSRGGSANQRGGGAYRRGGFGIENKGMGNVDPRRGNVYTPPPPKVPSV